MSIAVIDMGGTNTKFRLIESGKILACSSCPAEPQGGIEKYLNKIIRLIDELCKKHNKNISDCNGIVLLSTGLVNDKNMRILSPNETYLELIEFDFKQWAMDRTGLELRIKNDAKGSLR